MNAETTETTVTPPRIEFRESILGYATEEGLAIRFYDPKFGVHVEGADQVSLADSLPRIKERPAEANRQVTAFAVLDRPSKHYQNLTLDEKCDSSATLVEVGAELYEVGQYGETRCYTPAYEPAGTTLFVMVVHDEKMLGYHGPFTSVHIFRA